MCALMAEANGINTMDSMEENIPPKQDSNHAAPVVNTIPLKKSPMKRSLTPDKEPKAKKRRKNGSIQSSQTPLAILNELRSGLVYKIVSSDGPPHSPNFLASVEVDGTIFSGSANAKKQAKQRAAEAALLTLCPSILTPPSGGADIDFTKDSNSNVEVSNALNNVTPSPKKAKTEMLVSKVMNGQVNPVMALNEIIPGLKFECLHENSQKSINPFVFGVRIDNKLYQGSGSSKKNAKAAAARAVLLQKFANLCNNVMLTPPPYCQTFPSSGSLTLQPIAANKISELVLEHYRNIMQSQPDFARRKVLAGLVMTTNQDCTDGVVVSVGTGTKCVGGEHISVKGAVLNDSHAEIISRRGLVRYFYSQLLLHANPATADDSIFQLSDDGKGFCLKQDIRFHLYISTSPCGDARIFSPHDVEDACEDVDRHPNRQSRGQLRTKIESGEGTIPVKSADSIQTWDGVMQGERLLTMSCSDKVAKWNVVGLQGSLLSHFIEPIYLHSIVVGSLFHQTHLRRALYGRIENTLIGLPPPFRLNKILMNTTSSPEARQTGKAPNHSINWVKDDGPTVEVINAVTGKCNTGNVSRLSKQMFFMKFYELLRKKIPTKSGITLETAPDVYLDAKDQVQSYKDAKTYMIAAFKKAGLGVWMKKPVEQDQFICSAASC